MIKFLKISFFIILLCSLKTFAAIEFKADQGQVNFLAIGQPSALKIKGIGEGPSGEINIAKTSVTGKLSFQLNTLDTGIKMRTKHMKEKYLQTAEFPTALLTISKLDAKRDLTSGNYNLENVPFSGTLNLHGTEKLVSGTASIAKKEADINISAQFKINIQDYKIEVPSFAGITVAKDVDINVQSKTTLNK